VEASTRLPAALLAAVLVPACQARIATIRVEETAETVIPKGTILEDLVGSLGFDGFTKLDVSESEELQNQGVEPGDIVDVRVKVFELTAVAPSGADLSFLDQLEVSAEAPDAPRVTIASGDRFPVGEATVALDTTDADLTEHAVSRSMTVTTDAAGSRPEEDTTVEARFVLSVGVTGQGAVHQLGRR